MNTQFLPKLTSIIAGTVTMTVSLIIPPKAEAIVYGLKSRAIDSDPFSAPPANLYSFEEDGSSFTNFGALTLGGSSIDADGLAINNLGNLFGFRLTASGSTLISINPGISEINPIGSLLSGRQIRGAVFENNDLWVIDSNNNEVLRINPNDGTIIGIPQQLTLNGSPYNLSSTSDIAVDTNNLFYLISSSSLLSLNITTAELSFINTIGTSGYAGATFSDNGNDDSLFLYDISFRDDIFETDVNTLTTNILFNNIIPQFNSGRGDLAAIVTINTPQAVPESSHILGILGFGGLGLFSKFFKNLLKSDS